MKRMTAAVWLLSMAGAVCADPGYYLVRPYSEAGQSTLDLRYWHVDPPDEAPTLWPEIGLRYGVNSRWSTELLPSRSRGEPVRLSGSTSAGTRN
ncbi:hypothetical protein PV762_15045 [Mitsuaria sp. CC2]|uniref:hypothetical protein n=1 Tax=Mitsuaria sp. CC2 TaxID=3029186 RepID=UPI003B8D9249